MASNFRRRLNIGLPKEQEALRGKLVPSDPENLSRKDEQAVASAIVALEHLSQEVQRHHEKRQLMQVKLADAYWESGLLDWFIYLFDNHWHQRWEVISCVSSVLEEILSVNIYIIGDDEDGRCLSLITRLWFETTFDHLKSKSSRSRGFWGPFLTVVESYSKLPKGSVTRENIQSHLEQVQGIPMVNLILKRFKLISKITRGTCTKEFMTLVSVLSHFVLADQFYGNPLNRIIRGMAYALHYMVNSILPKEQDLIMGSCIHLIVMIGEKMDKGFSIKAVRTALNGRYCHNIAVFSPHLDSLGANHEGINTSIFQQKFQEILSYSIKKYLCYSSIRESLRPALNDAICSQKVQGTTIQPHWDALREEHRKLSSPSKLFLSLCDNPFKFHARKATTETLFRCSGCETAWYCSKECQRVHWKFDHREMCPELRSMAITSSTEEKLKMRDFRSVLIYTIPLAVKERTTISERIANYDDLQDTTVIIYDHTVHPGPPTPSFEARDSIADKLASVIPNSSIVQCRIPLGNRVATVTAVGRLDKKEDTKIWFAGQSYTTYAPATRDT